MKVIIPLVTFFLGTALTFYAIVLGGFSPVRNYTNIMVSNLSTEKITRLEVKYSGGISVIEYIQKGQSKVIVLSSSTEGVFLMNVKFESGHELKGSEEYYSSGLSVKKNISKEIISNEN